MRQQSGCLQNKILPLFILIVLIVLVPIVRAQANYCKDVKLVFTRGSSDNPSGLFLDEPFQDDFKSLEKVSGSFFQNFKLLIDRDYPNVTYDAVSVHNFPDLYNANGYRAVGIFGPKTVNNIFEAELYWWPSGEYRDSVKDGVEELAGYIKDEITTCPDELIVVGGYSQGAHVAGDMLFKLDSGELNHLSAVALFGDPKYIASDATKNFPVDYLNSFLTKPKASRWKRGTASLVDRGILDARVPYVPAPMENKTLSWCFNDDFICTGGSGILQSLRPLVLQQSNSLTKDDLGSGHKRYITNGVPDAVNEIVQRLSPKLQNLEAIRGGKDVNKSLGENVATSASDKSIDIMIMLNTSSGVDDVLGQLRNNTYSVLPLINNFYSNVHIGVGEYSETGETTNRYPRSFIRQQPTGDYDALVLAMNRKLSFGDLSGGGLDLADPHQLGIEKAIRATNCREDAEKHVVVITDRPLLTSISFNLCDSSSIAGFGIENTATCFSEPDNFNRSSKYHSEWCMQVYEILTQELCTFPGFINPTYTITRNEDSLKELMEASDISISFAIPHGYKPETNLPVARNVLQNLAQIGGGLYLEYDAFTKPNYTDMLWRVLNHQSDHLAINHIQDFDSSNSIYSESKPNAPMQLFVNSKQLFTVSTGKLYDSYNWDTDGDGIVDESTLAPQLELIFKDSVQNSYVTLTATSASSSTTTRIPITVVDSGNINSEVPPSKPIISATRNQDGSVTITWDCHNSSVIMIDFDDDQMPDISASCSQKNTTLQELNSDTITSWVENYIGKSEPIRTQISDYNDDNNSNNNEDNANQNDSDNQQNDGQTDDGVEYNQELKNNIEKIIKVLQQTQSTSSGNNTSTYNPQKTQSSSQKTSTGGQQGASLNASTIANQFDTKSTPNTISKTDGIAYIAVLAVLPVIIIIARIKLSSKK